MTPNIGTDRTEQADQMSHGVRSGFTPFGTHPQFLNTSIATDKRGI